MIQDDINRREWLIKTSAGVMGAGIATSFAAEIDPPLDIIDCHTHFYDPNRPEGISWPPRDSALYRTVLPQHLRELKKFRHVTGTVVIEAVARLEDNAWMLELAQDDPFIVGVVGRLEPGTPEFIKHLKRFSSNPLFRGIRVSVGLVKDLLEQRRLEDLKVFSDHDLALDVNGGPDTPAVIAQLAREVPELRIVLNHIGNVRITSDAPPNEWQTGIQAAAKQKNVFCKVSALVEGAARDGQEAPTDLSYYRPYIDVVWNAFGDDRVIFGSNWPVSDRGANYETLQRIVMEYAFENGDAATRKFCSLNAKHAYKWVDRPGRV